MPTVAGLLLAAGAGRRYGRPKALVEFGGEPLVTRACRVLRAGGCTPVLVVLGAQSDAVRALLLPEATPVVAPGWADGMGASVRAGLTAVAALDPQPDAVVVHLVDLPDIGAAVVARVIAGAHPSALARATFSQRPGHPVLLGRLWWPEVSAALSGDRGAGPWLSDRVELRTVECADLAAGIDTDTPQQLDEVRDA